MDMFVTNEQFILEIFTLLQESWCSWDAVRALQCTCQKPFSVTAPEVHDCNLHYVWL